MTRNRNGNASRRCPNGARETVEERIANTRAMRNLYAVSGGFAGGLAVRLPNTPEHRTSSLLMRALRAAPEEQAERVFAAWRRGDFSVETTTRILEPTMREQGPPQLDELPDGMLVMRDGRARELPIVEAMAAALPRRG